MANTPDNINETSKANEDMLDFVKIKVVGVGGGGNNAVSRMVASEVEGIEFININTDKPTLMASGAHQKIQIGEKLTNGQGAGSDPRVGKLSADESRNSIAKVFEDADAVFITAGMGGGTGTGAAPVVAEIARESGALTIGVVTLPFKFEGSAKMRRAEEGIKELLQKVDTLFVIPNEKIKEVSGQKISFANAFELADSVLNNAVTGIASLLRTTGFINLDFADLRTIMKNGGMAHLGSGEASGKGKVEEVAGAALYSRLMGTSVEGARRVIINVTASSDMSMEETDKIGDKVRALADPDANIIFGFGFDETLADAMRVIVVATDFPSGSEKEKRGTEENTPAANEFEPLEEEKSTADPPSDGGWDDVINMFFTDKK